MGAYVGNKTVEFYSENCKLATPMNKSKDKKRKIIKEIKRTVVYREYSDGVKSLKFNSKGAEKIIKWIAQDYITKLFYEKH